MSKVRGLEKDIKVEGVHGIKPSAHNRSEVKMFVLFLIYGVKNIFHSSLNQKLKVTYFQY